MTVFIIHTSSNLIKIKTFGNGANNEKNSMKKLKLLVIK